MLFQTCFLLWKGKDVDNQLVFVPIDLKDKNYNAIQWEPKLFVNNICQNIFFYVPQKVIQVLGESVMAEYFNFLPELSRFHLLRSITMSPFLIDVNELYLFKNARLSTARQHYVMLFKNISAFLIVVQILIIGIERPFHSVIIELQY